MTLRARELSGRAPSPEEVKDRKLNDFIDNLDFDQFIIFVTSVQRVFAVVLHFPFIVTPSGLEQEDCIFRHN